MNDYREAGVHTASEAQSRLKSASAGSSAQISADTATGKPSPSQPPVSEPVVSQALSSAGLPDTPKNRQIVSSLIAHELPIDAETLKSVARSVSTYSSNSLDSVILLRSLGVEVSASTLSDAEAFLAARDILLDSLGDINSYIEGSGLLSSESAGSPLENGSAVSENPQGNASAVASATTLMPGSESGTSASVNAHSNAPSVDPASLLTQGGDTTASASALTHGGDGGASASTPSANVGNGQTISLGALQEQNLGNASASAQTGTLGAIGQEVRADESSQVPNAQNSQNLGVRNGQGLQAKNSQGIQAQNGQTLQSQNSQGIQAQNGQDLQAQNGQSVQIQNGQSFGTQSAQNLQTRDGQTLGTQNAQNLPTQDVQNLGARNAQNLPTQDGQILGNRNGQPLGVQNGQNLGAQNDAAVNSAVSQSTAGESSPSADLTQQKLLLSEVPLKELLNSLAERPVIERSDISSEGIRRFLESAVSYLNNAGEVSRRKGDEAMTAKVDKAMNSMRTLLKLNDVYAYAEVPVKNEDENKETRLRFFANKKSRVRKDEGSSAVLHLNMPSLKELDIKLVLKGNSLKVDFYSSKEASSLLESDSASLSNKLRSVGVEPTIDFRERIENNPDFDPSNLPGEEIPISKDNIKGFDTRA
ncbi:MAG: flagellar hook-length control protein FliK [Lachnospiraceae bacterium]|nr:flagellar hook-length control protein FliK [Lachnospiraceae bacterium]